MPRTDRTRRLARLPRRDHPSPSVAARALSGESVILWLDEEAGAWRCAWPCDGVWHALPAIFRSMFKARRLAEQHAEEQHGQDDPFVVTENRAPRG